MNSLDRTLELFAANEPAPDVVQEAQRKLEQAIATRAPRARKSNARGWLAAAASAVVAAIAVIWLPLAPGTAMAFSEVQKHFRDFRALSFDMEQRMNGQLLMTSHISVLADGSVRTEVGDNIVVVVNPNERQVMTLVRQERIAVVTPLPEPGTREDAMAWLDEVRNFQGVARRLPETRLIRGQRAHGWELPLPAGEGKVVLWADEAGLPLEMKLDQGVAMEISFRFEFEPKLPADHFSTAVPPGYTLGGEDD